MKNGDKWTSWRWFSWNKAFLRGSYGLVCPPPRLCLSQWLVPDKKEQVDDKEKSFLVRPNSLTTCPNWLALLTSISHSTNKLSGFQDPFSPSYFLCLCKGKHFFNIYIYIYLIWFIVNLWRNEHNINKIYIYLCSYLYT